jgi:kynurenine formamidase
MSTQPDPDGLLGYFDSLSNWGRWGQDDQLGTMNFIDQGKRVAAASLITEGVALSCSRLLAPNGGRAGILHFMTMTGERVAAGGAGWASDWFGMPIHRPTTHVDAHAHVSWEGKLYNGASTDCIDAQGGARAGSIELLADGVVTRGVLLDIPLAQGRQWLDPGEPVMPSDLDQCAARAGVEVGPGDVLLVRTGHDRHVGTDPSADAADDAPGLHASCLPWLHERSIAMLGSDTANDVLPSGYTDPPMPIHTVGMVAMGLWLLDRLLLENLAAHCARAARWQFCFVASPLRLKRATGSPVNPLAIF